MINKKILSEVAFYYGELKMPTGFEIDKSILVKNISLSNLYSDVDYAFSREQDKISTYIKEYMFVKHGYSFIDLNITGNYFEKNEKTKPLLQVNPVDLKNSADFVCLYGIEIDDDSCEVCIYYDDNRRKGRSWTINLKTNNFIIFPSTQLYYINNINNTHLNYIKTITYQYT